MICSICEKADFESLAELNKERELLVCRGCGNVMYRVEPEKEEEIKEYYRKHYRPAPTIMNLITTSHKQKYVALFLRDFLKERQGTKLTCGDVGCATGYIPAWLRSLGHRATAAELTITYRRFAEHFYGIPVTEELSRDHQYDLITIYHVLEHLMTPDVKLKGLAGVLKGDGRMMVSTPEWLDVLEEASGSPVATFEMLFHKDHINVFTKRSIQNLFAKCGLQVERQNFTQYGQTYLLQPAKEPVKIEPEDYKEVIKKIRDHKLAIDLYNARKLDEALAIEPKFPDAWIRKIHEDFHKDRAKQADIYKEALTALPENPRMLLSFGTWLYMGEELEAALKVFEQVHAVRPNEDIMIFMGWCCAKLNRQKDAMDLFNQAVRMNPMKWGEAMNAICKLAVELPCWEERAIEEAKSALFNKSGIKPILKDPIMGAPPAAEGAPA